MKLFMLMLALGLMSFQADAAYECSVKIQNVLIYANGMVNVLHTGRGDYTVVCNMDTNRRGVSPVTCAMWAGMLQSIKKKGGTANIYYDGTGSCATLPIYDEAPAPVYIGDVTP